jgi:2-oxoisovalerate dehydrogenase E1 component alpha subunit
MVLGMTMKDQILASLAKADDPNSGGRQMPSHYGKHALNIISTGSPVATQVLHAAGIAYAAKMRGHDLVCLTSLGEGSTSEGDFYEGLNFAAIHKLPVICVVENNQYAISVRWDKNMPFPDAAERASAFGIPGVVVDGNDPIACYYAAFEAHQRARAGRGPTLIEAKVNRLTGHSSDDDEKAYRPAEELEAVHAQDCLSVFRTSLEQQGILAPGDAEEIRAAAVREVDADQAEAEACADPDPSTAMRYVTGDGND